MHFWIIALYSSVVKEWCLHNVLRMVHRANICSAVQPFSIAALRNNCIIPLVHDGLHGTLQMLFTSTLQL